MDKLKLHSLDLSQKNIDKIMAVFPNCVTEKKDENGDIVRAIDFDLLRQELSDHIVEGPDERYRLDWPGKRKALFMANAPIAKTLRPVRDESVDFDNTKNLFIEGDNLDALKLLQETYLNKVKMIYIDPPYNTGHDFIYNDDFAEDKQAYLERSNQVDEDGNRLVTNNDSNGRFHSDWLSMMYPRLKLARNLLRDDGVIFISIDDNEQANLKRLCDEVFGEDNFIAQISRKTKLTSNKGKFFAPSHEYVLIYSKYIENCKVFSDKEAQEEVDYINLFRYEDNYSKYNIVSLYQPSLDSRPNQRYYIECPDGSFVIPPGSSFPLKVFDGAYVKPDGLSDKVWRWSCESYLKYDKKNLVFIKTKTSPLLNENGEKAKWNVYTKIYLKDRLEGGLRPVTFMDKYPNSEGSKELIKLKIPFSFSKPKRMLTYFIKLIDGSKNDIVLDFFAGSGTTAHAVMQLNAEDGGKRQCISVQLPELTDEKSDAFKAGFKNIAEICKERIRRAGKKIKEENPEADLDIGFRVLKIDTSNMNNVYYRPDEIGQDDLLTAVNNIKPDRTAEDLLFQVLLDWGVDLTLPIVKETIAGKSVYFVDDNALAACFEKDIDEKLVKELAQRHPMRVVFRDNGFVNDAVKINVTQIFKLMSPDTDIRTI